MTTKSKVFGGLNLGDIARGVKSVSVRVPRNSGTTCTPLTSTGAVMLAAAALPNSGEFTPRKFWRTTRELRLSSV